MKLIKGVKFNASLCLKYLELLTEDTKAAHLLQIIGGKHGLRLYVRGDLRLGEKVVYVKCQICISYPQTICCFHPLAIVSPDEGEIRAQNWKPS